MAVPCRWHKEKETPTKMKICVCNCYCLLFLSVQIQCFNICTRALPLKATTGCYGFVAFYCFFSTHSLFRRVFLSCAHWSLTIPFRSIKLFSFQTNIQTHRTLAITVNHVMSANLIRTSPSLCFSTRRRARTWQFLYKHSEYRALRRSLLVDKRTTIRINVLYITMWFSAHI